MRFLCATAVFLTASTALAQTFYVAPTGNDLQGDGSPDRPYASITTAMAAAPLSGGTIIVRDGVYAGRQRINRKFTGWLVIRAENPYRAVLQSGTETALHIFDASYVEVSGFDILRSAAGSGNPLTAQISRAENIILRNNVFHDSRNNDVLKINEAPRNILIIGNLFFNAQGEAGQHIDINGGTDVVVRDNIFSSDFEGEQGKESSAYIVIKNSGDVPESRRFQVTSNIFLNWQGSLGKNFILLGEDGKSFHETQDVVIENNLMIGNSPARMRAAFGAKGVKDVVFRNNTIAGDLPASAFAVRLNREGANLPNRNLRFFNNIWSDPTGTMGNFSDGLPLESSELELNTNLYWNAGQPLPGGSVISPDNDGARIEADPMLGSQQDMVLPRWAAGSFASGSQTIRQEFERLVAQYGTPAGESAARGRGLPEQSPRTDILDRIRGWEAIDLGAVQTGAESAPLRLVLAPSAIVTGGQRAALNQIIVSEPAGPDGLTVTLASSNPAAVVPETVTIAPGSHAATFTLETATVTEMTGVTITATAGDLTRTADLQVAPERVSTINLAPEGVRAGLSTSRNMVLIDGVAPPEGAVVWLSSSNPDIVSVPESVVVPAGRSYSEPFSIHTRFTPEPTAVTIQASWAAASASVRFELLPTLFSLSLRSAVITSGETSGGNRIFLPEAAPPGGAWVRVTSTPAEMMILPEFVVVPEGSNITEFSIKSASRITSRVRGAINASWNGKESRALCDVAPLAPKAVSGPATLAGGATGTFRIQLTGRADEGGTPIRIEVTGVTATYPVEVIVPEGETTASFRVATGAVAETAKMRVSATFLTSTASATVNIEPVRASSLWLPATLHGGASGSGIVYLTTAAPPGGLPIQLSSSDPGAVTVPETIVAAEGATTGRFTMRAAVGAPSGQAVAITATTNGISVGRKVQLISPEISSLTISPSTVRGGATPVVIIGFRGTPAEGSVVELSSSNAEVVPVPATAAVPSGVTSMRLSVPTRAVTEVKEITVTVRHGSSSLSRILKVQP